jgi:hypothetical protein
MIDGDCEAEKSAWFDESGERAKQGLFQPPTIGAQVICPHCGAPHATPPGMDELFAFVCYHCGNSAEVPKPPVQ